MTEKFKNKYRIESNRWQTWDYSEPGFYFITICTHGRENIFGQIIDGKMQLSEYGEIVKNEFIKMDQYNQRATIDEWVIMPNHVHCIIALAVEKIHEFSHDENEFSHDENEFSHDENEFSHDENEFSHDENEFSHDENEFLNCENDGSFPVEKIHEFSLQSQPATISQPAMSQTTEPDIKQYRRLRRKMLVPVLLGKFQMQTSKQINILRNTAGHKTWQPNYHDHVIRDDAEYQRIKQYIINNPLKWNDDTYNDLSD